MQIKTLLGEGTNDEAEVVVEGKSYPRTKVGFVSWAKENVFQTSNGETGQLVKEALDFANLSFDVNRWDEMKKAVRASN